LEKTFVLIDALALAYKAYYAFISRPLKTSYGFPTSAIFGFLNQLFRVIEEIKPDYLAVAFDSKEKTFRHDKYPLYKSSRETMPEDLIPQIEKIKEIIAAFDFPVYIKPGFEADDLIGTAAVKAEKAGLKVFAVTPDKDYIQLVSSNIFLVKPAKNNDELEFTNTQKVIDNLGITPNQMIDYLALIGDSSDDIPGVAGIGPKTAAPLLHEFGNIENLYEKIDFVKKDSVKNKLILNKANAFLSKDLATIITDVDFDFDIEKAKLIPPKDIEKLMKLFAEFELKNFGARISRIFEKTSGEITSIIGKVEEKVNSFSADDVKYKLIVTHDEAEKLALLLQNSKQFVFDTETDGLNIHSLNLAGASFSTKKGEAYFVAINPFGTSEDLFSQNLNDRLPIKDFIKIFKPVFENPQIKKICQNGKFDIGVIRNYGINVNNFFFDTMLASYLIDPDQKHGMDELSQKYLNYKPIPLSELIGEKKDPSKIFSVELEKIKNYAAEDADVTLRLFEIMHKEISGQNLDKLAYEVEFPLAAVLEDMERTGIKLDVKNLKLFGSDLLILLDNFSAKIIELAGVDFNINSTKQLQEVLFERLKLNPGKKTKTGFSTDARSLENLRGEHEIIDVLLNYRQISKLKSTYADALPELINPKTGKIHTTFNQTVASTGRLSSINPNLQNIPIRTELGKEIRKAFIPSDGNHLLLSADYSQIELRIMASICGDEGLTQAFLNGEDIHRSTAAQVFKVSPESVTADMRRKAKEVNFGILYGIGAFGLKTRLGITQTHAKEIIQTYFSTFGKVKAFMEESIGKAKEKGYAETLLGRRRFLPNINSKNHLVRQFEERVAINMPIQGTAADMIKLAMIKIHNDLAKGKYKTKMVLQVHDELVFDVPKEEVEEIKQLVKYQMENAFPLNVPVIAETGIGENWLEAH